MLGRRGVRRGPIIRKVPVGVPEGGMSRISRVAVLAVSIVAVCGGCPMETMPTSCRPTEEAAAPSDHPQPPATVPTPTTIPGEMDPAATPIVPVSDSGSAVGVIRTRIAKRTIAASRTGSIPSPTPRMAVRMAEDGTASSSALGLMWSREVHGLYEFEHAEIFCRKLELADYHDWRLPTIDELDRLMHSEFTPGSRGSFHALWSSTPDEHRGVQTFDLLEWQRSSQAAGMAHALCVRAL